MIPKTKGMLSDEILFEEQPSLTYFMNTDNNRIFQYCDGVEAVKQAIYKIINTERYECPIYSWNYGIELKSLFGMPCSFCIPELERRIEEALLQDTRIKKVYDFEFDMLKKGEVSVSFKVDTIKGIVKAEKVVSI